MKGLTDFDVLSSPFFYSGEEPHRLSVESASRLRKGSRRAAWRRLERRRSAIVAADAVGFSRLIGRDEEGAVRRLCELQSAISPVVQAAGGRIVNTVGDAMLLEFSSTVAALGCALAIQDLVGLSNRDVPDDDKMLLRIGVNVGDVIVEGGDVFGEVVNVASRLEAIAEPGGICISHACYMQNRCRFPVNFTDLGEQRLKNIAEPVRAYAVHWPRAFTLEESVPSLSSAPGAFPLVSAPPFAEEEKIASNGELTAAEAELAAPLGNSRPLTGAATALVAKSRDAFADGRIVESASPRQAEPPNVLQWLGRRRA